MKKKMINPYITVKLESKIKAKKAAVEREGGREFSSELYDLVKSLLL